MPYPGRVPRLWKETVAEHRDEVRGAIMDATWTLVTDRGLLAVTMSLVAQEAGIGRATLYKYFPDVEAILVAWHERHVNEHLQDLQALCDRPGGPWDRLEAVSHAYARICRERARHGSADLDAVLHRDQRVTWARERLHRLFEGLLTEAAAAGDVRTDVPAGELAAYCLHALTAAGEFPSEAAVRRLVAVTLDALRPPAES